MITAEEARQKYNEVYEIMKKNIIEKSYFEEEKLWKEIEGEIRRHKTKIKTRIRETDNDKLYQFLVKLRYLGYEVKTIAGGIEYWGKFYNYCDVEIRWYKKQIGLQDI